MVGAGGFEPSSLIRRQILSLMCKPIPPRSRIFNCQSSQKSSRANIINSNIKRPTFRRSSSLEALKESNFHFSLDM